MDRISRWRHWPLPEQIIIFRGIRCKNRLSIPGPSPEKLVAEIGCLKNLTFMTHKLWVMSQFWLNIISLKWLVSMILNSSLLSQDSWKKSSCESQAVIVNSFIWLFLLQYYENLGPRISKFSTENFPLISSLQYENGVIPRGYILGYI